MVSNDTRPSWTLKQFEFIVGNHGLTRFAAFDTTTFGIFLCPPGHQYFVVKLCSAIGSGPVDPPTLTWRSHPEQGLHRSAACVVIERSSALVEAACMPRLTPREALAIEVMAELVAESAQKRTEIGRAHV